MTRRLTRNVVERNELLVMLQWRQKDRCAFCGRPLRNSGQIHHRKLRARRGGEDLDNLALIHPACHRWTHDHPAEATRRGWIVPSSVEPGDVPVQVTTEGMP